MIVGDDKHTSQTSRSIYTQEFTYDGSWNRFGSHGHVGREPLKKLIHIGFVVSAVGLEQAERVDWAAVVLRFYFLRAW